MRRFRQDHLSNEAAEQLLSGADADSPVGAVARELREAGPTEPSEAVAARHLAAIVAETRRPPETLVAPAPRRAALSIFMPVRMAAGATAFAVMLVLAVAGALPGPVQAAASDVLGVVGISVPDGRSAADQRKEAPEPARTRPEPSAAPATVTLPDDVDQITLPRSEKPVPASGDDDGAHRDGERGHDEGDRDEGDRESGTGRESDDDGSGDRHDEDGASGKDEADDDSGSDGERDDFGDDSSGESGRESDELEEPDEPDGDSSGRSGGDELPLSDDEPDEPDEPDGDSSGRSGGDELPLSDDEPDEPDEPDHD